MIQTYNDTYLYRKNQHAHIIKICTCNIKICPYIFSYIQTYILTLRQKEFSWRDHKSFTLKTRVFMKKSFILYNTGRFYDVCFFLSS